MSYGSTNLHAATPCVRLGFTAFADFPVHIFHTAASVTSDRYTKTALKVKVICHQSLNSPFTVTHIHTNKLLQFLNCSLAVFAPTDTHTHTHARTEEIKTLLRRAWLARRYIEKTFTAVHKAQYISK